MRLVRIIVFFLVYFFFYLASITLFAFKAFIVLPEAMYYWQRPIEALQIILFETSQSPFLILTFVQIVATSLVLGLVTELGLEFLRKHFSKKVNVTRGIREGEIT